MVLKLQKQSNLLLIGATALLLTGSAVLYQQLRLLWLATPQTQTEVTNIQILLLQGQSSDLKGAFPVDSVDNYTVQREGKDAFSLLLAHYKDRQKQQHRAVLFPKGKQTTAVLANSTELRQTLWQEAGQAIKQNTPENALFLSWWDEGQRVHFLSGREAWISKPAEQTFTSNLWKNFQDSLLLASTGEASRLTTMARWLTMDSDQAIAEIRKSLDTTRPVYLLVTNDLLMRLSELADYGGSPLAFNNKVFEVHDNLHDDIRQIKQWSYDIGEGNYLIQKEGSSNYRVWATANASNEKNTLLVRLLPFVDSLKKLPEKVQLVYQSHWGAYLSIYKLNLE